MVDTSDVIHNAAQHRYELKVDGQVAFARYRLQGDEMLITYVETPVPLRGGGVAGRLMKGLLVHARAEGLKVTPVCPYAVAYMQRHPDE